MIGISEPLTMPINSVSQEIVLCSSEVLKLASGSRLMALIGPLPAYVVIISYSKM